MIKKPANKIWRTNRMRFRLPIILLFISLNCFTLVKDYSKGPLYGKNMYLPFFIYYNFPGFRATEGRKYDFTYHFSTYYIQDFCAYKISDNTRYYDTDNIARDYEGLVSEFGTSFYILKNLEVGSEFRIAAFYPGILDAFVEAFHNTFKFPNGGRESFSQNQIYINLENDNNIYLYLDKPAVSFCNIDMWVKYTFFQRTMISLAAAGSLTLPTGSIDNLSGTGFPDIGFQLLADFKPYWIVTMYFQAGLVIPLDSIIRLTSKPNPMFNGLFCLEISPVDFFSLMGQINFKSSPISGGRLKNSWVKTYDQLSLPQANVLIGFVFSYKNFRWQFYFEEDAFTNQGTDFTVNIMFSQKISLGRFY